MAYIVSAFDTLLYLLAQKFQFHSIKNMCLLTQMKEELKSIP